jgi:DNA-directed RNA polymerase subunit RPC12/RpoP
MAIDMAREYEEHKKEIIKRLLTIYKPGHLPTGNQPLCAECAYYKHGVCMFLSAKLRRSIVPDTKEVACPNADMRHFYFLYMNYECRECGAKYHAQARTEKEIEEGHRMRCPTCFGHYTLTQCNGGTERKYPAFWVSTKDIMMHRKPKT